MKTPTDAERLDHLEKNPEDMRFVYDMIGEVYVNNRTGELAEGKDAFKVGIREVIDECIRQDAEKTEARR